MKAKELPRTFTAAKLVPDRDSHVSTSGQKVFPKIVQNREEIVQARIRLISKKLPFSDDPRVLAIIERNVREVSAA